MSLQSSDVDGIDFVTMGMFIIDDIHYRPPRPPVTNILGGAGTYAALGARIFSPPPLSKTVGWIVDAGSDFPLELRHEIAQWRTSCLLRETPWRKTTRGWNGYNANEERAFEYLTPKLRLDEESLTPDLLASRSFHLICSSLRCIDLVQKITQKRKDLLSPTLEEPLWIWEPVPDRCEVAELENCLAALKLVDVVSPNHMELCSFFGQNAHSDDGNIAYAVVENCCQKWIDSGIGRKGKGVVVVRAGKDGCCVVLPSQKPQWIPAYHQDASAVVDPTGGGNCFLGALSVALVRQQWSCRGNTMEQLREAILIGSVAASFAIEQVGLPDMKIVQGEAKDVEQWNGENVMERLRAFKDSIALGK